jgi:hypothetical protein
VVWRSSAPRWLGAWQARPPAERVSNEQIAGKRWQGDFERVTVTKTNRPLVERFTLIDLREITEE